MPVLFTTQPGYATTLPATAASTMLTIAVGDFGGADVSRSIVTQMSIQRGDNVQFVHTLQDLVYVYSFGERVGTITVAGVSFVGMCDGGGDRRTGIEYAMDWYEANRVSNVTRPTRLLLGGANAASGSGLFRGYLTGLRVDVARPDARLANFGLQFQALPQRRR